MCIYYLYLSIASERRRRKIIVWHLTWVRLTLVDINYQVAFWWGKSLLKISFELDSRLPLGDGTVCLASGQTTILRNILKCGGKGQNCFLYHTDQVSKHTQTVNCGFGHCKIFIKSVKWNAEGKKNNKFFETRAMDPIQIQLISFHFVLFELFNASSHTR